MADKTKSAFCRVCNKQVMALAPKPNHVLHLLLSVFTLGLWIPIWVLVSLGHLGGYRCTNCGAKV